MLHQIEIYILYGVEALFFTGLVGCVLVVSFSWVSIFKSGFSDRDD